MAKVSKAQLDAQLREQMFELLHKMAEVTMVQNGDAELAVRTTEGILVRMETADVVFKAVIKKERVDIEDELEALEDRRKKAEERANKAKEKAKKDKEKRAKAKAKQEEGGSKEEVGE